MVYPQRLLMTANENFHSGTAEKEIAAILICQFIWDIFISV